MSVSPFPAGSMIALHPDVRPAAATAASVLRKFAPPPRTRLWNPRNALEARDRRSELMLEGALIFLGSRLGVELFCAVQ